MPSQAQVVNLIGEAVKGYSKEIEEVSVIENDLGLVKLGSGHFSTVYKHPFDANLVIKIGRDVNDGWLDYAAYCIQYAHEDERLLRVLDARVFGVYYVAVMERLEPMTVPLNAGGWKDEDSPGYLVWYKARQEILNAATYSPGSRLALLQSTVRKINDLHDENAMLRGDVVVLTDPFSFGGAYFRQYKTANGRIDVSVKLAPEPVAEPAGLTKGVMDIVAEGFAKLEPGQWRVPKFKWQEADFRDIELRALQHMQQIPKRRDQIGRKEWRWDWEIPKLGDQFIMKIQKDSVDAQPIPRERALVVKDGSPAAIRAEKEDRMLRVRSKHDNTAYTQGVQRALLPECRSRRVQTSRIALVERAARAIERHIADAVWVRNTALRLHPKYPPEQDAMAA